MEHIMDKPMQEAYVQPSRKYAHSPVPEGKNKFTLDMILERIQRH